VPTAPHRRAKINHLPRSISNAAGTRPASSRSAVSFPYATSLLAVTTAIGVPSFCEQVHKFSLKVDILSARREIHDSAADEPRLNINVGEGRIAEQPTDERERYVGYSAYCLKLAKVAYDSQSRTILRDGFGVAEVGGAII
jgi:hypothetical protein